MQNNQLSNKKFLLNLAREAIQAKLENRSPKIGKIPDELKQKRGCFVTLTIGGQLRGCIGNILPVKNLCDDVMNCARSAAFSDPRFMPLTRDEFKGVKIEVSLLDSPKKLNHKSTKELLDYLAKNKPGVIIKKGLHTATFLPQVWDELPHPEGFLSRLCFKADLPANEWHNRGLEFKTYRAEKIS